MTLNGWVPLSAETDATRRRQRTADVARAVRAHAIQRAGGVACPICGGADPVSGIEDVCHCGLNDHAMALQAKCLRNAREAS